MLALLIHYLSITYFVREAKFVLNSLFLDLTFTKLSTIEHESE